LQTFQWTGKLGTEFAFDNFSSSLLALSKNWFWKKCQQWKVFVSVASGPLIHRVCAKFVLALTLCPTPPPIEPAQIDGVLLHKSKSICGPGSKCPKYM
jgi:hypothetical protein